EAEAPPLAAALDAALGADRRGDPLAELGRGLRRRPEVGGVGDREQLGDVAKGLDLGPAVRAPLEVGLQAGALVGAQMSERVGAQGGAPVAAALSLHSPSPRARPAGLAGRSRPDS